MGSFPVVAAESAPFRPNPDIDPRQSDSGTENYCSVSDPFYVRRVRYRKPFCPRQTANSLHPSRL
jgi:hypothetical protein